LCLIEIPSRHLPRGTEEDDRRLSQDSLYLRHNVHCVTMDSDSYQLKSSQQTPHIFKVILEKFSSQHTGLDFPHIF
jgi:hypothetical protein